MEKKVLWKKTFCSGKVFFFLLKQLTKSNNLTYSSEKIENILKAQKEVNHFIVDINVKIRQPSLISKRKNDTLFGKRKLRAGRMHIFRNVTAVQMQV